MKDRVVLRPIAGQPRHYIIAYRDGGRVELVTDQEVIITAGPTPFDVSSNDPPAEWGQVRPTLTVIAGGKPPRPT